MRKIIAMMLAVVMCLSFCACGSKTTQEGKNENHAANANNEEKLSDEEITDLLLSDVWYSVPTNRANGYQFVGGGICYLKIQGASQDFSCEWKISDGYVVISVESFGQVQKNSMRLKKWMGFTACKVNWIKKARRTLSEIKILKLQWRLRELRLQNLYRKQ